MLEKQNLKKGLYVRTTFGIKQIFEINHKAEKWKYLYKLKKQNGDGCIDLGQLCDDDIIDAPSFNVIDLIKEGDLIETPKEILDEISDELISANYMPLEENEKITCGSARVYEMPKE